jgi:hypothetical protein
MGQEERTIFVPRPWSQSIGYLSVASLVIQATIQSRHSLPTSQISIHLIRGTSSHDVPHTPIIMTSSATSVTDSKSTTSDVLLSSHSCHLSTVQVDGLLRTVFGEEAQQQRAIAATTTTNVVEGTDDPTSNSSNRNKITLTLPSPLAGRSVLIPCTGQAFWVGELQPTLDPETGEEQLQVLLSVPPPSSKSTTKKKPKSKKSPITTTTAAAKTTTSLTVPTSQVYSWLQSHASPPRPPKSSLVSTTWSKKSLATNNTTSASTAKSPIGTQPLSLQEPQQPPKPQQKQPQPLQPSLGGFVDIHEVYTADGRQVSGEAVDITHQLESLWQHHDNKKKNTNNNSNNNSSSAASSQTLATSTTYTDTATASPPPTTTTTTTPQTAVSDDEYHRLMTRLDELALLEEEQQQEAPSTTRRLSGKSMASLQNKTKPSMMTTTTAKKSAGWNKGFLNTGTKTKTKTKKVHSTINAIPTNTTTGSSSNSSGNSSSIEAPTTSTTTTTAATSRVVSFSSENEIQEIPRIGTRSTSSIQKQPPSRNNNKQYDSRNSTPTFGQAAAPIPRSTTKPIEESVFSGVIRERPITPRMVDHNTSNTHTHTSVGGGGSGGGSVIRERPPPTKIPATTSTSSTSNPSTTDPMAHDEDEQPPRRMSRFARERQGQMDY